MRTSGWDEDEMAETIADELGGGPVEEAGDMLAADGLGG
jgi:hypothetical protein